MPREEMRFISSSIKHCAGHEDKHLSLTTVTACSIDQWIGLKSKTLQADQPAMQ